MLQRNTMTAGLFKKSKRRMGRFDTYCKRCIILKCTNYGNFEMRL